MSGNSINLQLPNYQKNPDPTISVQENYHEELNQTLRQLIGENGWQVVNITNADLTTRPILDPNLSTFTTVMDLAPVGTIWFVIDASPPVMVQKLSANPTVLGKFTTTSYP